MTTPKEWPKEWDDTAKKLLARESIDQGTFRRFLEQVIRETNCYPDCGPGCPHEEAKEHLKNAPEYRKWLPAPDAWWDGHVLLCQCGVKTPIEEDLQPTGGVQHLPCPCGRVFRLAFWGATWGSKLQVRTSSIPEGA
jgi:hypothetical protein